MRNAVSYRTPRAGFTLVELSAVVVAVGVLSAFGVPRFLRSVERTKAAEAFSYLAAVRSSQERYRAATGGYASAVSALDVAYPVPPGFSAVARRGNPDAWALTLTRVGASSGYGAYTVTFTERGYDPAASGIHSLPEINPTDAVGDGP